MVGVVRSVVWGGARGRGCGGWVGRWCSVDEWSVRKRLQDRSDPLFPLAAQIGAHFNDFSACSLLYLWFFTNLPKWALFSFLFFAFFFFFFLSFAGGISSPVLVS